MSECDYGYESVSTVYVGFDNAVTVVPYSDITARTVYDMSTVTEVTASVDLSTSVTTGDDITASSNDNPTTIWWDQTDGEWRIHFKIGLFVGIVAGTYDLRIVIIDTAHPNGLVLTDSVPVVVVGAP